MVVVFPPSWVPFSSRSSSLLGFHHIHSQPRNVEIAGITIINQNSSVSPPNSPSFQLYLGLLPIQHSYGSHGSVGWIIHPVQQAFPWQNSEKFMPSPPFIRKTPPFNNETHGFFWSGFSTFHRDHAMGVFSITTGSRFEEISQPHPGHRTRQLLNPILSTLSYQSTIPCLAEKLRFREKRWPLKWRKNFEG